MHGLFRMIMQVISRVRIPSVRDRMNIIIIWQSLNTLELLLGPRLNKYFRGEAS